MTEWDQVSWVAELVASVAALVLLATGRATLQPDRASAAAALSAFVVVIAVDAVAVSARLGPSRLAPVLLAVMTPGLLRSDSPLAAVVGFAASALLPVAAVGAARSRGSAWTWAPVVPAAVVTFATRVFYRDPFHELRCAPACVQNPWLVTHVPDLLRGAELGVATLTLIWVAFAATANLRQRAASAPVTASTLLVLAIAAVFAGRLVAQPRPVTGDAVDRWVTIAVFAAVCAAAALWVITPLDVLAVRRRIGRFASALSNAGDETAISTRLREVTGDPSLQVVLGGRETEPSHGSAVTTVMRNGRVVATISHVASARSRVAAAVTPATALALETQLLLQQARQQLVELETSRAAAVHTTDEARRRLERDLHDGAQQRLLVVGMELAHAAAGEGIGGTLHTAAERIAEALTDVRRIGRGDAAIIAELGLDDAVLAIAGTAEVPMSVVTTGCAAARHDCWPQSAATTAYRLVNSSLAAAQRSGATGLSVALRCLGESNGRTVLTDHDGDASRHRGADHDRVLASGGRVLIDDGHVFEAWLP